MSAPQVIVAGLGAMGSAAASALARRGVRVLGLDLRRPPHDRGSSHGESRILREAYFEHPLYVPLVRRALGLWRDLEQRSGRPLLRTTGVLLVSRPGSELIDGARRSCEQHDVPCESLTGAEIRRRYPVMSPAEEAIGLYEPGGGVLDPGACIASLLDEAAAAGAELRFDEALVRWTATTDSVDVVTTRSHYGASRLLLAAGAWIPALTPGLPLQVERQVQHWFEAPDRGPFSIGALPAFLFEETAETVWYGVPDLGRGLKVAIHHGGDRTTADALDRNVAERDVEAVRRLLHARMPAIDRPPSRSSVCMYTNTPDGHFLIDQHPDAPSVLVVSACSGHGFKFASAIGELAADWVSGVPGALRLEPFRLDRPMLSGGGGGR
ncbi:MAG TPA: N-methyl-L-tryptophan oxidase [Thermoanaerobaculia bacterium]|nr:N-methyl-L-tryptophan oxidase [Thermoanaerobaculia bacterium]